MEKRQNMECQRDGGRWGVSMGMTPPRHTQPGRQRSPQLAQVVVGLFRLSRGSGASGSSAWTLDPQVSSGLTPRLLPASSSLTLTLAIPLKLPSSSRTHPLALLYFLRCTDHFEHTTSSTHLLAVSLPANVSCTRAGFFFLNRYCSLLYEWINEWTKLNPHKFQRKKITRNKTFSMLGEWYYEWPFFFYFPNIL